MMGMYADFNYLYVQAYQIPRQQSVSSQTPIFFNSQREDKRLCHLLQYFLRMSPPQDFTRDYHSLKAALDS